MTQGKQARLLSKLGDHMSESAGGELATDDRFHGFVPNDAASGEMALDRIMEDVDQPRKTFDEQSLQDFAKHLKSHGVQQAIQLRWSDTHGKWLIVYGHRRYRAAKMAGLKTIPCTFTNDDVDEPTIRIRQLVENCQREDLAPMEMARAVAALGTLTQWSNRRMAEELGFTHRTIGRYLDLLKLPEDLQESVNNGELAPSVAIDVLRLKDQAQQKKMGREIAQQKLNRNQARQMVDHALGSADSAMPSRPRAREKQLLTQNVNITIFRNPDATDAKIQDELLAAASLLDPEKAES